MNLPFIKKFNKKVLPSYFLVLVLRDEKVNAVVFEEIEGRAKIVGQKEEYFSYSIDDVSQDEFLQILDSAISQAESSLPENIQTQKTIFGVKESWTDQDQIKKEHLVKLKKASEELGLTPIGFLVVSQAISHLLAKEEGAPVSAILAEVNRKIVTVTLLRAGKSIETKSSEIHESIPFTVDSLLKHFDIPEILPSRIIIFNGKEDLSQEFISHAWSKSLPFLHLPQITNLPDGFDAKAVLFGAATQMGFAIAETSPQMRDPAEAGQKKDETQKKTEMQNISDSVEDSVLSVSPGDFGFAQDMDVAKVQFQEPPARNASASVAGGENIPQIRDEEFPPIKKSVKGIGILLAILEIVFMVLKKINIKNSSSIFARIPKGRMTIVVPLILFAAIALIASYFLFLKAIIAITIDPKIIEQNKDILFSTINRTDPSQNVIRGEFVPISQDGNVSTATTGKKDVGTKAKGTVIIFNSESIARTLVAGTLLKAPNGLEFALDSSTNIKAVASHSADETVTPEKTTANITANQLGKESNLPSGTKFSIASFDTSDLIAKNDNPLSGGTKKEVTVVSKDDEAKLENELIKQLESKAKSELEKQIGEKKVLLPIFISNSISKKSLNAKVGDETNQLTLTGTVEFQGISYDKNDLITFSKSLLEKDVPANHKIDYNNIKTSVKNIEKESDEEIQANLGIKALLLPKIDESKLAKNLKGKSFKIVQDILYKLPQVSDVDIILSPKLFFLPKNLPSLEKNIKFLIKIDG